MRRQIVEKLAKEYLLSDLPGFVVTRGILHKSPIEGLLRGFWFDSSALDKYTAYVYVFVQPLYVPSESLFFTFGKTLGYPFGFMLSNDGWDLDPKTWESSARLLLKTMVRHGLPFLRKRDSVELFIRNLKYGVRFENTIFDREALANSLAWLGEYTEAAKRLKSLIRSIKPDNLRQDVRENAKQLLHSISSRSGSRPRTAPALDGRNLPQPSPPNHQSDNIHLNSPKYNGRRCGAAASADCRAEVELR